MIKKILFNIWYVLKNGFQLTLVFLSIVGTYFTLINPDISEIGIKMRIFILTLCFVIAYIIYLCVIFICRKVIVYEEDQKKIAVQYGDFIKIIDKYEKSQDKAIFVIPVNRCFDTIVDDVVVEKGSVHGQFVKYCTDNIYSLSVLNDMIDSSLKIKKCEELEKEEKDKGKMKRYPVGTVAKIESVKGNVFYLLAFTTFKKVGDKITVDESINMYNYLECLQSMVDYYNLDGRNLPIYIPTIGCGLSRLHISIDNSVKQLLSIWNLNHDVIRDCVNIVIYNKNFWNVNIMKYKKEGK